MEFQPDYIIAWDFAEGSEYPHIRISRLRADKKATQLLCDVIATSEAKSGVVSMRQLLDECRLASLGGLAGGDEK